MDPREWVKIPGGSSCSGRLTRRDAFGVAIADKPGESIRGVPGNVSGSVTTRVTATVSVARTQLEEIDDDY
jgi:hypothetical protein